MATEFIIRVVVDPLSAERGTRRVKRGIQQVDTAAAQLQRRLRQAFTFTAIALGVRQLGRLADTFTNIQNRLRVVTEGEEQLTAVTGDLFAIANRTRVAFETTAEIYSRTALAARELGRDQSELLTFTESLNQAVIIGGASSIEAAQGLRQLSQGIASGTLRGDELRSVLEQLPVVADVISESLGVTRGELRKLGESGVISADVILDAFSDAREEISERFAIIVPTLGQSLVVLRNNFIGLVGGLDEATGASAFFSMAIIGLAEGVGSLSESMDILAGASEIVGIVFQDLFGDAEVLIDVFGEVQFSVIDLADSFLGLFNGLNGALLAFALGFKGAVGDVFFQTINGIRSVMESGIDFTLATFETISTQSSAVGSSILSFFDQIGSALFLLVTGQADAALELASAATESFANQLQRSVIDIPNVFRSELASLNEETIIGQLANPFEGAASDLGQAVKDGFIAGIDVTVIRDIFEDIKERAADARADAETAAGVSAFVNLSEDVGGGIAVLGGLAEAFSFLNPLIADYTAELVAASDAQLRFRTASEGASDGVRLIREEISDVGSLVETSIVGAFRSAEDTIVSFAATGKADFQGFVDGVLADLARLALRQAILGLFPGFGVAGPAGPPIPGLQGGGDIKEGESAFVGEGGVELFTAPTDGQIIPAGETAAIMRQGQAAPVVNVAPPVTNIRNVIEGDDESEREDEVLNIISRKKQTVRAAIS